MRVVVTIYDASGTRVLTGGNVIATYRATNGGGLVCDLTIEGAKHVPQGYDVDAATDDEQALFALWKMGQP
jgi:hypothetical protein